MLKPKRLIIYLLFILIGVPTSIAYQQENQILTPTQPQNHTTALPTNQIIVKFSPTSSFQSNIQLSNFSPVTDVLSDAAGVSLSYQRPMSGQAHVLRLPEKMAEADVAAYADSLSKVEGIEYAVVDRMVQIVRPPETSRQTAEFIPNDAFYTLQWHYGYTAGTFEGANLEPAWDITTGSSSVVVAVVDTGIVNHVDLAGQTVPGYDFIFDPFVANDGNGRDGDPSDPGDWTNANECFSGSSSEPSSWHGTHVAGTVAAKTNNGEGVAGVAGNSRILPVRVLGKCGGYSSDVNDGVRWAAGLPVPGAPVNANPAKVINMSLTGVGACTVADQNAINAATAVGATIVVAAGNSNQNAAGYTPASCNGVITVAASDRFGDRTFYSNFGAVVDITAPGGDLSFNSADGVLSTLNVGSTGPGADSYAYYQGTSMAAPHVAGVAALVLAQNSSLDSEAVGLHLTSKSRDFPAGSSCSTSTCGSGLLDAFIALSCTHSQSGASAKSPIGGTFFLYLPFLSNC